MGELPHAIVQARMSSTRLPGKVLKSLAGSTVLGMQLDRLASCPAVGAVIVATSVDRSDDPIAEWCEAGGIECVRGPLDDVAARFVMALERYPAKTFYRYCADRPLYDTRLLEDALHLFRAGSFDLVTNTLAGGFPSGLGTELLSTDLFLRAYPRFADANELEHVTQFFYRRSEELSIGVLRSGGSYTAADGLSLDTEEDWHTLSLLLQTLERPVADYRWTELVDKKRALLARASRTQVDGDAR